MVAQIRELEANLHSLIGDAFESESISELADDDVAELLAATGRMTRRLEALQIGATDAVCARSGGMRENPMTDAYGCARPADLVQRLLGSDTRTAVRLVRASRRVHRDRSLTEGVFLPPSYPALRAALLDGAMGVDALLAATDPIEHAVGRISDDDRSTADAYLADVARGIDPAAASDDVPRRPALPEELAVVAKTIVAYLDPDGAEPSDDAAARARFLTIGSKADRHGVIPIRGGILPEAAAQLRLLMDSLLNPRVAADGSADGVAGGSDAAAEAGGVRFEPSGPDDLAFDHAPEDPHFIDLRTRPQRMHDAFMSILTTAAGSDLFPHIGGAAPTLVITATADDLARGTGWASIVNTGEMIPMSAAKHLGCAGGIQRVLFDDNGRIVSIGTSARIFNALQRRAITVRDGGCVIPGCTIPAPWCEVHHVQEHARGGATHTDNGVLLCWYHHRTIDRSEWTIRMTRGTPEVRGPRWWDPDQRWHRPRSPHRRPVLAGYGPPRGAR